MDDSRRFFWDMRHLLKSWIPWRSETVHVSRDFWMPDQSCMVCYECDAHFTLFNRRHHCRHCGRIFCAKCTSNWVPTEPSEPSASLREWDKVRVCNYCFRLWKQGLTASVDNGPQVSTQDVISTSPSLTSFFSTKSSGTCGSNGIAFASISLSAKLSPHQSAILETALERRSVSEVIANDHSVDIAEHNSPENQFGYTQHRSDDEEEEEYRMPLYSSRTSTYSQVSGYCGHDHLDDINSEYKSCKVHPDGYAVDLKSTSSSPVQQQGYDSGACEEEGRQIVSKESEHDIGDECEALSSSLYVAGDVNCEPEDFDKNGVLWVPPEPEDEEDEKEAIVVEENENEGANAIGEWGYLHNSSSYEEHKRAMKSVVGGHFRALVAQLLEVENLLTTEDKNEKESWLEIITALSWEAVMLLKPDTSKGGQMDPAGYVKVKCLASGLRNESFVVKGIVCRKNVAHRRMKSKIEKPRLLILGGALEYQRVSNALSSLDTLLQQETDHLKMAVAKIETHNPNILLVEKSVSRYAQEYLLAKGISLVLNIKRSLLERISRCTGAQIVPSIDHLSPHKLGYCDIFHVERCLEEHGSAGQAGKKLVKTLMYFEGYSKPLGCTILLRGTNGDELKKVKHVVQYGVFAAYHLALETSFLADEGASLPELPLSSPITVALPEKPSNIERSISTVPAPTSENNHGPHNVELQRSSSVPTSELFKIMSTAALPEKECCSENFPAPMSSQYAKSFVLSSAESFLDSTWNTPSPCPASGDQSPVNAAASSEAKRYETESVAVEGNGHNLDLNILSMQNDSSDDCKKNISDPLHLQLDGKVTEEQPALKEEFPPSPSDHQSILVSLSSRCVWKGTVCERSHLFRIKYYGSFDKPLGRFLRDHLFDQNYVCPSCGMPAEAHVQCYTHQQGSLMISVKKLSDVLLPGEQDGKIWMWHRCLRCPRIGGHPPATRRVVMSDAAWGLSFGKFLELSFSNHAAASRVASCGHSLHRDCLRFYGFGQMVACFRYASINVHQVYLPPHQLDFNYENQEWLEKELNQVVGSAEHLFTEVRNAIQLLKGKNSGSDPESAVQMPDLEGLLLKEKLEFEATIQKIQSKGPTKGEPTIDILELNRLRRQLIFQSYIWDHRLVCAAADVENQSSQAASTQKPLGDAEKIFGINVPDRTSKSLDFSEYIPADLNPEKNNDRGASDMADQSSDESVNFDQGNEKLPAPSNGAKTIDESDPLISGVTVRRTLSDGTRVCLSDTLDAAWTGESHPSMRIPKNKSFSGLAEVDASLSSVTDKWDMQSHRDDLSLFKLPQLPFKSCTKVSDNVDDTKSWLSMPFLSFYRTFNKNFSGSVQKLDAYDPVYISSFRESELQSGARLLLPVGVKDTVVPVYDDEPTSMISFALISHDYHTQLKDESDRQKKAVDSTLSSSSSSSTQHSNDSGTTHLSQSLDETAPENKGALSGDESVPSSTDSHASFPLDPVAYMKAMHARVSFSDDGPLGKVKYTVTCYFAKRFETLRKICCPSEMDYIRSLSRCKKWGAQGGKSNVFFAKTLDDRFIIKQVTKTELESFIKFAPDYFKYLSESISTGSPTCLAKILGIYQVASKHIKGGKETKMDFLVMENLLFRRNLARLYDLKGSSRSRYNADSSGSNKVLLDQNLIESMPTSPIFVGNKAKRLLERAVWNDTAFLASVDVMDYSLLVGVDEEKRELVLGIIDFMRQYTWDKHLETWVKASGILGGPKNASPTVISPKQYKMRFRKAMTTYFLMVPDQWSPTKAVHNTVQTEAPEDNSEHTPGMTSVE
ncbi:1-phosphatidylinositol-3-phosphate 5-kinase FAB1B-like [Andrographis paniculata]|uniref:1-phosphatidylinositol-3-phosphate 5-kinase FAB1B-like n=1 Tax=Andrographis paniculata TaxID=175694 RepID=UPI0021E86D72|nr:1-phosphatidylinositol-3-phosphate 5-kinase FAB1B-like [Andrographis paniculata]